jgi:hypothetical protein
MDTKIKFAAVATLLIANSLAAQPPGSSRLLTRAEITAAIQKSLDANGFSTGSPLQPGDISIEARVIVTEAHPNLTVMRIESRPGSAITDVALWTASEPRIPPFWVKVDRPISQPQAKSIAIKSPGEESSPKAPEASPRQTPIHYIAREAVQTHPILRATPNDQPLIHVGNPIELVVQGAGMRITAKAKALETGREGQQIRVECEPAGKILVARVVSAEAAEIDY